MHNKTTWADQYKPTSLNEIVGHATTVKKVRQWAESWKQGKPKKPLLLHGPPGSGKTAIVEALKQEFDWEMLEVNASDTRNKENVERVLGSAAVSSTLSGKKRLILIDEVDGLYRKDHGGTRAINRILKEATVPIILTANDAYAKKIRSIKNKCTDVKLRKVHPATIAKLLHKVAEDQGIKADKETLKKVAKNSNGDIRSAINDFQALAEGKEEIKEDELNIMVSRNIEESIFNAMKEVLKKKSFEKSKESLRNLNENPDFVLKWIDENIPRQYEKEKDLQKGFEALSRADIHMGRARRTRNYGLWRYASVMMGPGVSLAKEEEYHGYVRYGFPSLIRKLGSSKKERNIRESIASKIGEDCHVSVKTAIKDYLPMFKELMKEEEKAIGLTAQFEFNQEELEFLGINKTDKIIEEAEKIRAKNLVQEKTFKESRDSSKENSSNGGLSQKSLNHF